MTINTLVKLALTASVAIAMSACESKQGRPFGKRKSPAKPQNEAPKVQLLDECPAAEGTWMLSGGTSVFFDRQEGFLTLQHPDLTEALVFDGKARRIKQTVTGVTPEVTATCKKKIIYITYKFESKTVAQMWTVDLEKDSIGITIMNGLTREDMTGSRVYSKPSPTQDGGQPGGV